MFEKELMELDKNKKKELLDILNFVSEYFNKNHKFLESRIGIFYMENKLSENLKIHDFIVEMKEQSMINNDKYDIVVYDKKVIYEIKNYLNSIESYLYKWYNYKGC